MFLFSHFVSVRSAACPRLSLSPSFCCFFCCCCPLFLPSLSPPSHFFLSFYSPLIIISSLSFIPLLPTTSPSVAVIPSRTPPHLFDPPLRLDPLIPLPAIVCWSQKQQLPVVLICLMYSLSLHTPISLPPYFSLTRPSH